MLTKALRFPFKADLIAAEIRWNPPSEGEVTEGTGVQVSHFPITHTQLPLLRLNTDAATRSVRRDFSNSHCETGVLEDVTSLLRYAVKSSPGTLNISAHPRAVRRACSELGVYRRCYYEVIGSWAKLFSDSGYTVGISSRYRLETSTALSP